MSNYPKHQLTKEDADELCKAVSLFQSDEKTKQLAQQYILEYRHTGSTNEKSSVVVKCALFFAEKSQYLYDMKGQRIQGIGLSLNQIIKTYPNIDEFVLILKDFVRKVRLPDLEVENELHTVIERINFSQTFYNKYEKILKDLNFMDKVEPGYYKIFSNFIWLLFIDAKAEISNQSRDIVKNTCLLATVFYSMIRYCLDYIKPMFLVDFNEKMNGNKQIVAKVIGRITEKIFSLFLIQDFETYKLSVSDFDDYFETLLQTNILKNNSEKIDFFNPDIINLNYKRLDAMYQKRLGPNDLDQRFFLKNRITTLTPSKITPFEKQGAYNYAKGLRAGKRQKTQNINPNTMTAKNFYSHRVLDYESQKQLLESKSNHNLVNNDQVKQLKFPKNVLFSPSISKTSLICATPVTLGMEMYNYIIQKPRIVRESLSSKQYESFVNPWVSQFSPLKRNVNDSIQQRKTKQMRSNIITSLYIIAVQSYFNENQESENRQQICKSFLALSAQTVCFVCNIPQSNFESITEGMDLDPLDLYKAIQYFYRFDKLMPSQLRSHFIDIETKLINSELWKRQQSVEFLSFVCHSSPTKIGDKLLKSVFQNIIEQLTKLSTSFKLSETVQQQIFTIMKCLLCFQTQLLFQRFLDQLLICCFYAICKNHKIEIKFNDIKTKYQESNPNTKQEHKQMMCNVYIDDTTKADIIKFYNGVFIASSKVFVKDLQGQFFDNAHTFFKLKIKQVPIKDAYHSLKRHRMKNTIQQHTSSKYLNAKKVLNYGNERNNYHQLNTITQGQDQKSVQRDRQLLRAGKSNPSTRINTAKTQAYHN